jgi:uncharacterized membrane protein
MESHKRSVIKATTWRLLASLVTMLVIYLFTREVTLSIGIGVVDAAIKVFVYYSHERMWDRIEFGRRTKVEEDYMI